MWSGAASLVRAALKSVVRTRRRAQPSASCRRLVVRSEGEIRAAALQLSYVARHEPAAVQMLLRELVQLNTPALYLNIVQSDAPAQIVLRPWPGRTIRFRGRSYLVEAGSESPEGIEAFVDAGSARITTLYPTAPDHPVFAISLEHQHERIVSGHIPAWATHVTIVVNGRVVTRSERLLRERGPRIWAA